MSALTTADFSETLWQFYAAHGRHDLPWRQPATDGSFDAYSITVSEIMLQQTQVARVIPKFEQFLSAYPTVQTLAAAELTDVLKLWSGLGYNRRAKYLRQAARQVVDNYQAAFPNNQAQLQSLPGIGVNTAGAIMAYAFNKPVLFVETNIRTVFIHHFFDDQTAVSDAMILATLEQVLDHEHPREFYWALMDYGSFLKQSVGNLSKLSTSYTKQSAFVGSKRQLRGQILRLLSPSDMTAAQLTATVNDQRLGAVLDDLQAEGLIHIRGDHYHLGAAC